MEVSSLRRMLKNCGEASTERPITPVFAFARNWRSMNAETLFSRQELFE